MNRRNFFTLMTAAALPTAPSLLRAAEPVSRKADYNNFTDEQEMKLGQQMAARYEKENPIVRNPVLDRYLTDVAGRLGRVSQRRNIRYYIKMVDSKDVNAVSLPGGYIYVNRGLFRFTKVESEFVSIVSHEVGHIVGYHSMNMLARQKNVMSLLEPGRVLAGPLANDLTDSIVETLALTAYSFIDRPKGREAEREADLFGLHQMTRAGWDPQGMVDVMNRFAAVSGNTSIFEGLFSTHPPSSERAALCKQELSTMRVPGGLAKDSISYRAVRTALNITE